ncbi:MAG: hypothetical protein HC933_23035, partial [Pleurocapsa sp. SU_196_0]|nr:hypothetical protein [Pleurocapsa sp. SU_196_0]
MAKKDTALELEQALGTSNFIDPEKFKQVDLDDLLERATAQGADLEVIKAEIVTRQTATPSAPTSDTNHPRATQPSA